MFIVQMISNTNRSISYVTNVGTSSNIKNARKFKLHTEAIEESWFREKQNNVCNVIILNNEYKCEVIF